MLRLQFNAPLEDDFWPGTFTSMFAVSLSPLIHVVSVDDHHYADQVTLGSKGDCTTCENNALFHLDAQQRRHTSKGLPLDEVSADSIIRYFAILLRPAVASPD